MRPVMPAQAFTLRLQLAAVPATLDEIRAEIGDRLELHDPRFSQQDTGLELSLTVLARDLWLAVLVAMAAVTDVGYRVDRLDARPNAVAGSIPDGGP